MPGLHARLSPSASPRWMRCPGSVALCANLLDEPTEYSAEGDCAHVIREECLRFGLDPWDYVGTTISSEGFTFEVTEEWAEHMQPGIDRVREFNGKLFVEHRVKLDRWLPGQFGTLDAGVVSKKLIVINDFKFGAGVPVDPVENEQLMTYALGFWDNIARHQTDAEDFLIIIDQPRTNGGGEWRIDLDTLLDFGRELKKAGKATYRKGAPLVPGEKQCQFCPAAQADVCVAYTKFCFEMTGLDFDDLDTAREFDVVPAPVPPRALSPERRTFIALHAAIFRSWLKTVSTEVLSDYFNGKPTPGAKVVSGRRGPRHWTDQTAAEKRLARILRDEAFTKQLKSPAQAEKLVPSDEWARLEKFIGQSAGKPSLVPLSDKREGLQPDAVDFKDLDFEDED